MEIRKIKGTFILKLTYTIPNILILTILSLNIISGFKMEVWRYISLIAVSIFLYFLTRKNDFEFLKALSVISGLLSLISIFM